MALRQLEVHQLWVSQHTWHQQGSCKAFCVSECLGTPNTRTSLCCVLRDRNVTTSSFWEHCSRGSEGMECSWMELDHSTAPQPAGLPWKTTFGSVQCLVTGSTCPPPPGSQQAPGVPGKGLGEPGALLSLPSPSTIVPKTMSED